MEYSFPTPDKTLYQEISNSLIQWYACNKRNLPWRSTDAWGIWVSEIMLQQTRVSTVIPFYLKFMQRFPNLQQFAEAPIEEVLKYWAGLGYYARVRNLHRAAIQVMQQHNGIVPMQMKQLLALPGIGRYTAGAILSLAGNIPAPLVDANVTRILCRLFGFKGDPAASAAQKTLWLTAEYMLPAQKCAEHNQALMELGEVICTPFDPKCSRCPLCSRCYAAATPCPESLPESAPGKQKVSQVHACVIVEGNPGCYFMVQRPLHGLWGGLWEFPRVLCHPDETWQEAARRAAHELLGIHVHTVKKITTIKHMVTHHNITLHACLASSVEATQVCSQGEQIAIAQWPHYACSAPQSLVRQAFAKMQAHPSAQHILPLEEISFRENL